jgi:hypothetical protein
MHIRTQAIDLMPEIEQNCMTDLATCRNPEVKGEVRRILTNVCQLHPLLSPGNEMSAKEIQETGNGVQRCRSKFHADDHVGSNFGFSLNESVRTNDSIILRGESELNRDFILDTSFAFSVKNIEAGRENDLIRCLVKHKNEQRMDYRCKAGIDHHQIVRPTHTSESSQSMTNVCFFFVDKHERRSFSQPAISIAMRQ